MYGVVRRQARSGTRFLAIVGYAVVGVVSRGLVAGRRAAVRRRAERAVARAAVPPAPHRGDAPRVAARQRRRRATSRATSSSRMADMRANAPTIDNVRLWERDLLKQTFGQLQEIRTYYDFVSVSDDRYMIDGQYRQVHLSARELNTASLPTRNFINERLTFTHGMGITMAPVNQVTAEGLPVLFIKDLPPVSTVSLKVTRPQIYYGELTEQLRVRRHGAEGVRLSRRRDEHLHELHRAAAASASGRSCAARSSRGSSGRRRSCSRRISRPTRASCTAATSSSARKTALPFLDFDPEPYLVVTRLRAAEVDPRRVHVEPELPVRAADGGRHELHAQQREGRDRRVRRHRRRLPRGSGRSDHSDVRARSSARSSSR